MGLFYCAARRRLPAHRGGRHLAKCTVSAILSAIYLCNIPTCIFPNHGVYYTQEVSGEQRAQADNSPLEGVGVGPTKLKKIKNSS